MEFERTPLPIDSFPQNLQMHIKDGAPAKMKMMAAQGMVPAPPADQLRVLYQLHFEDKFRQAAADSAAGMPANVIQPVVEGGEEPALLDWLADVLDDTELLKGLVLNKNTDDATIYRLATKAEAELGQVIANNQVRVLRSPAIVSALYQNANVRMATVDRLLELAQRNEVDLSGFPQLNNALKGAAADDSEGLDDEQFDQLMDNQREKLEEENELLKQLEDDSLTRSERERLERELAKEKEEKEEQEERGNVRQKIAQLNIAQKIRLATVGSREAIKILVRDPNKLVHMSAIKSPRMKLGDIKRLSSNKALPDGVINYIAKNREWTSDYEVLVNLTMNPKTPLSEVTGFLKHLRKRELQRLSRNRNVSHQVSRMAKRLMKRRR